MTNIFLPATILATPLLAGILSTVLMGTRYGKERIPGLLFHSIVPEPGKELSHYPLKNFKEFSALIKTNDYQTICVRDIDKKTATTVKKPLLITFDDGLDSVYRYAMPTLALNGQKATIFCLSSYFGRASTWDIYSHNKHCTRKEIREISDGEHEIGSHTVSHPCLPYLEKAAIKRELIDSKNTLEDIIGKEVTSLSFPYGSWNKKIWECAKQAGYTAATLYRGRSYQDEKLYPVRGVYKFDTPRDIINKINPTGICSIQIARSKMMSHFAQGTPIWKYRKSYSRV